MKKAAKQIDHQAPKSLHRVHSSLVIDGPDRAASRAMLHAVGFTAEDFKKSHIGIASTWSMVTPCNMHIDKLAIEAAHGTDQAGAKAVIFNTITISDGISMGTEGMKYSLVSREVIADSIETVMGCEGFDGIVAIGGCDKNMPGCLIALARLNRPGIFVYGGTIMPGCFRNKNVDVVSVFEAVGKHAKGEMNDQDLAEIEACAIPGAGSCGGMYTANTMACAIEALGMSLPNSSAQAAISKEKVEDCHRAGAAVVNLLTKGIRPRDIMTRKAFENAITVVTALGGSTNAVLHLLAMAHAANVKLSIDDFTKIGKRVPVLADLKPSGRFVMAELVKIGGLVPLMKMLLDKGLLHGDCLTVTGKTIAENLANAPQYPPGQEVIRGFANPIKPDGHLVILYGNLAPSGAVAKISGKEGLQFTGRARVFNSEEAAMTKILSGGIKKGDVIVIRYEGPQGGPGMREMLGPTSAVMGCGLGKDVALITDGRFSGGSHGFVVGHITPEAFAGGPLAIVRDGDPITIDAHKRTLDLGIPAKEIKERFKSWKAPRPRYTKGVLAKYAKLVSLKRDGEVGGDVEVDENKFLGFDAYKNAMDLLRKGDVAIFTTPLAFRAVHFQYAIEKGLNVFMEKPLTADGPGSRRMLALAEESVKKNLKVGVGLMSRHSRHMQQLHQRIQDGEIGDLLALRGYRMQGGSGACLPRHLDRRGKNLTEVMFQISRFHSFLWLSGGAFSDFYIHHVDHLCWMKNAWPVKAQGVGGRHYKKNADGIEYVDQNFDNYVVEYTFTDGTKMYMHGRGVPGARPVYNSWAHGTKGIAIVSRANDCAGPSSTYKGQNATAENRLWQSEINPEERDPYKNEWVALLDAIRNDKPHNEVKRGVEASVVCNMGRMATHTAQEITFDEALNHEHNYAPNVDTLTADGPSPLLPDAEGRYPKPQPGQIKNREYGEGTV